MSAEAVPLALRSAAAGVHDATIGLIRAAEHGDAAAIDGAIHRRAEAVVALRAALAASGALDPPTRRGLLETVVLEAGEAQTVLAALMESIRAELQAQARGSRVALAYGTVPPGAAAASLDRDS